MTKKVSLLFPGQGSQYVGMGKSLEGSEFFNTILQTNEILGYDLCKVIFEGPESDLQLTHNAQPAILAYSTALCRKLFSFLSAKDIQVESVLGHSLGEYSALVAANALSYQDALHAVHMRGKFMQQSVPVGVGKMIAIMKVPEEKVIEACKQASQPNELVMPANFNEPNQIVISGNTAACDRAVKWLEDNLENRFRAMELKVSAPFHSSYMQPAAQQLKSMLNELPLQANKYHYIANIDACAYPPGTDSSKIRENLVAQMTGTVKWTQSIAQLPVDRLCIEVGPGKVLAGLVGKINPDIKVISLDKDKAFDELQEICS